MDWSVLFYIILYFFIGSRLADFLEKDDDVMAMVVFLIWPVIILCILLYIIIERIVRWRDNIGKIL